MGPLVQVKAAVRLLGRLDLDISSSWLLGLPGDLLPGRPQRSPGPFIGDIETRRLLPAWGQGRGAGREGEQS